MAIEVKCDYCGQRYRLPDKSGGKIGKCKRCGILINIPATTGGISSSPTEPSATISDASVDEPGGFPWRTAAIVMGIVAVPVMLAIAGLVVVSTSRHRSSNVVDSAAPVQGQTDAGNAPIPRASAPPANPQDDASQGAISPGSGPSASSNPSPQVHTGTPYYPVGRSGLRPTDTGPVPRTRFPEYGTAMNTGSGWRSPATGQSVESLIATLKAGQSRVNGRGFLPEDILGSKSQAADAAEGLLRIGTFEAVTACLQYGDSHIRHQAIRALGRIEDPRAVDALTTCLKDSDPSIQNAAVQALRTKGSAASGPLASYLQTSKQRGAPGEFLRGEAQGYGPMVGPREHQALEAKRLAAKSLSQSREPGSMDALIACLRDDDPRIQSSGAYGLAKVGPQGVDYLIQCLADPDVSIRTCAAEALGKSGDSRAIPPLAACLADGNSPILGWVVQALNRLQYEPSTVQEKVDFYLAQGNVGSLTAIGSPAVDVLIKKLRDPVPSYRSYAAIALAKIGDARAVEPLVACLADEDRNARNDMAEALWELGDIRGAEAMASCLRQWTGTRSQAWLPSEQLWGSLRLLDAYDVSLRRQAISEFAKVGGKKAVAALRYALPDRELNSSLVSALSKLGWKPQSPEEEIYLWIARKDKRSLERSWSQTSNVLLKDVRSGIRKRVENGVYAFVALGRLEIVPELVSVLDSSEGKETAEIYLNSGQKDLVKAGEDWAKRHKYDITGSQERPKAKWGQW